MGEVLQKSVHNHLVFYDSVHTNRWYDVIGPEVQKYINHFENPDLVSTDQLRGWTMTESGSNTLVSADVAGGAILATTGGTEDNGIQAQLGYSTNGEHLKLDAAYPFYVGARVAIGDVDEADFFVGFSVTDTDFVDGVTNALGFRLNDGDATMWSLAEKGSSETTTALADLTDGAYVVLEMYCDGSNVCFYMDGTLYDTLSCASTNYPDDTEMRLTWAIETGATAALTLYIDWLRFFYIHA